MTDDRWSRLGALLEARRLELGFPRRLPWARDVLGLSNDRIQSDIEKSRRTNFDAATLAQVEQQYEWAPGSIQAVLNGGDPTPISRQTTPPADVVGIERRPALLLTVDQLEWRLDALTRQYVQAEDAVARALSEQARIAESLRVVRQELEFRDSGALDFTDAAARDIGVPSRGQQQRDAVDQAGEPQANDPDDMEPR